MIDDDQVDIYHQFSKIIQTSMSQITTILKLTILRKDQTSVPCSWSYWLPVPWSCEARYLRGPHISAGQNQRWIQETEGNRGPAGLTTALPNQYGEFP